MTFIKNFIADESGASAAEYALIIAIVGVGIGAAALALGANVTEAIGNASNEVAACNGSGADSGADADTGFVTDYTDAECASTT